MTCCCRLVTLSTVDWDRGAAKWPLLRNIFDTCVELDRDRTLVGLGQEHGFDHAGIAIITGYGEETAAMATETIVDIKDFAYAPNPVQIPSGGAVTWINNDTVPHTATGQDRAVLQSGRLDPGDRFSQIFDTPGTFDYFCEYHASMQGTVIVH